MAARAPQGLRGPSVTVTDDYTITPGDFCVRVNAAEATITLPAASQGPQMILILGLAGLLTVVPAGVDTIGGQAGPRSTNSSVFISDGVDNWFN